MKIPKTLWSGNIKPRLSNLRGCSKEKSLLRELLWKEEKRWREKILGQGCRRKRKNLIRKRKIYWQSKFVANRSWSTISIKLIKNVNKKKRSKNNWLLSLNRWSRNSCREINSKRKQELMTKKSFKPKKSFSKDSKWKEDWRRNCNKKNKNIN